MSDLFIDQLAHLCRTHVTRAKWVFVPSHAIGRTLGEQLARAGTNWLNLRFVTPLDIALRMGAPFLVERGIDPSEEGLGPALIMRLLLDLPEKNGYFRPLADQPTLAQALWTTIRELRMAGVKSGDLEADAFESPAKHAELRALLAAYETFLASNNRGDMATVYEEAVKHLEWCPIQSADCWTELPDVIWTPLQQRVIDLMPGEHIAPRALAVPGASIPRRLQVPASTAALTGSTSMPGVERVPADAAINPLAFLMKPGPTQPRRGGPEGHSGQSVLPFADALDSSSSVTPPSLNLFAAGGREAEVEEIFRRILAAGVPLDEVEIVCASDDHVSLVWEKALRHEWGVTLGTGIGAGATRPGRALIGLCDWIETDFSAAHLRHLLQSGDMGLEKDDEGFTAGEAARTLARAEAGWGRATYSLALGALRKGYETRANDADVAEDDREVARAKAKLADAVLTWINRVIASIPEPDARGNVPLQDVVTASLEYIERSTARSSQLDHRAAAALTEHVSEMRALEGFSCPLAGALRFIRERVQSLNVAADRPRPGYLYVCSLSQAGYSERPHMFVAGLEEGRVFPTTTEDAVLLDAERAEIAPALRLSRDKIDEAVYAVLARLAATGAGSNVTFSYSVRDTREFRETYASWLMLQAFRLQQGDPSLSYQAMKSALGEPVSSIPLDRHRASSNAGWWLRSVVGSSQQGVNAVRATFAGVARGRDAQAARETSLLTEFDGHVPEAGKILDPCASTNAFSVTDLEAAATCGFRFFLKRGLGLRPVDERERDRDVWLDPLTRGSELHAIYASAMRRCRDANRRPSLKQDGAWLRKFAEQRLSELQREMPPATEEIFERESRDFLADVELFLEGDCEDSTSEPLGFEVSFGRPLDDDTETLAREEPVDIDLGHGLTFRIAGRIDRIDKVGPSSFEIVDYKTGGFYRPEWTGTFNGGRRLQHALYGLAAVELLRAHYQAPKVTGGVYYFSSRKGGRERVRIPAPTSAKLAEVLADLRELIVHGSFAHTPHEGDCRFCDYKAACTSDVHDQTNAKLEDATLGAYGKLIAHE